MKKLLLALLLAGRAARGGRAVREGRHPAVSRARSRWCPPTCSSFCRARARRRRRCRRCSPSNVIALVAEGKDAIQVKAEKGFISQVSRVAIRLRPLKPLEPTWSTRSRCRPSWRACGCSTISSVDGSLRWLAGVGPGQAARPSTRSAPLPQRASTSRTSGRAHPQAAAAHAGRREQPRLVPGEHAARARRLGPPAVPGGARGRHLHHRSRRLQRELRLRRRARVQAHPRAVRRGRKQSDRARDPGDRRAPAAGVTDRLSVFAVVLVLLELHLARPRRIDTTALPCL